MKCPVCFEPIKECVCELIMEEMVREGEVGYDDIES